METIEDEQSQRPTRLKYTFSLKAGTTNIENYGLKLARISAVPKFIINLADKIIQQLPPRQKVTRLDTHFDPCYCFCLFIKMTLNITDSHKIQQQRHKLKADLKLLKLKGLFSDEIEKQTISDFEKETAQKYEEEKETESLVPIKNQMNLLLMESLEEDEVEVRDEETEVSEGSSSSSYTSCNTSKIFDGEKGSDSGFTHSKNQALFKDSTGLTSSMFTNVKTKASSSNFDLFSRNNTSSNRKYLLKQKSSWKV